MSADVSAIRYLELLADRCGAEWEVKANTAIECMWSAEVRWTPEPNHPARPDRSYVTFATAAASADAAIERAASDLLEWIAELDGRPER